MASFSAAVLLLQIFVCFEAVVGAALQKHSNSISPGTSLTPITQPNSWQSPSRRFALGFYQQGSGFLVGIWLVGASQNITVWTANRDYPPVSSNAMLEFTTKGKLLLRTGQSEDRSISTTASASFASMLDSGNFVLYSKDFVVIWQSFDFPTDTILGGQILPNGHSLFSSFSETNHSTGKFRLKMQYDGNLVAYPASTEDISVDAYWTTTLSYRRGCTAYTRCRDTLNPQSHLDLNSSIYLNSNGSLLLINNTDSTTIQSLSHSSHSNNTVVHRATLDIDGNFRLYSHPSVNSEPVIEWKAIDNMCDVKSFCGFNSYCTLNDNKPYCSCIPGADFLDHDQQSTGCERNFTKLTRCKDGKKNEFYDIITMDNLKSEDRPYYEAEMTKDDCSKSCLEDCLCDASISKSGYCMKFMLPLRYIMRQSSGAEYSSSTIFFKVGTKSIRSNNHIPPYPQLVVTTSKKALMIILVLCLSLVTYSCFALAFSGLFIFKHRVLKYRMLLETGSSGLIEEFTLRLYSYNELRKATNGFKEKLGQGSFGTVYRGALYKGKKLIAVKRLEKVVEEGEKEFRAEMRAIGRTRHKNLVRLLGYCAEGSKRLLVYEFMSNGSLADLLFRAQRRPDWTERVRIGLDVARGILYLHEECEAPTLHCDIKPHNILLDEFWTAKISDFGLAKLLMPDQTRTFTQVRGTRGYLAPEWQKNIPITVKVDVYSYGIVLLEIVCCRRNIEVNVLEPEEVVLSNWVYKCFVARELNKLVGGEEVDKKILENMVKVGLWCIQDEPVLRPSMKSVVLMLEGITDIATPPCPTNSSM
ncbi:G-type lectin S-receptor-like serine/threonine-protein kinase LECRK1 [Cornus florida]|uniref:G-type lectin S-receptor-like serine/threonine-protein kinase LECRK1 n=1 Tax=Cornus florida TaxID=4283 RepID=UPI0028994984|nr:G-type lectin S-receptor-like serine/threonine-protein kinase LECRK1 [Cornus florida]